MKQCPDGYELELYLDEELPSDRQEQLAAHLRLCTNCKKLAENLLKENMLFASALTTAPIPPNLIATIALRMNAHKKIRNQLLTILIPAVIGLAGTLASFVMFWSPLFDELRIILEYVAIEKLIAQIALMSVGLFKELAQMVLSGRIIEPALTLFVICIAITQIKLNLGGRINV